MLLLQCAWCYGPSIFITWEVLFIIEHSLCCYLLSWFQCVIKLNETLVAIALRRIYLNSTRGIIVASKSSSRKASRRHPGRQKFWFPWALSGKHLLDSLRRRRPGPIYCGVRSSLWDGGINISFIRIPLRDSPSPPLNPSREVLEVQAQILPP